MFAKRSHVMFCGFILALCCSVWGAPAQEAVNSQSWVKGQQWKFLVKQYYRDWLSEFSDPHVNETKNDPRLQHQYEMVARIGGFGKIGGKDCVE